MSQDASCDLRPAYLAAAEYLRDNSGQWTAYESTGNCVVLAGPGSGKTKTLTTKMARMLYEDIRPPQGIACITYSTECARELKRRLDILGIEESRNVYIGTVHGFCLNHVVRPYAKLAKLSLPEPIQIPDENMWMGFFDRAVRQIAPEENPRYLKTTFERYRRTHLDRSGPDWQENHQLMPALIETFEYMLHGAGYLDFDDMALTGLKLIQQHNWIRAALRARFPVLVVDEYQDLGVPLHQIVIALCFKAHVRVLAVGDPDQSIYGFNGAEPRLLRDLAGMPDMQSVSLKKNYRCGKKIVAGSMVTLEKDLGYEAVNKYDGLITVWECPGGLEQQSTVICERIVPDALGRRQGRCLGDIAILYLDKYDAIPITEAVRCRFKYVGGDKEISYKRTPLTRWLEDCAAWCVEGWRKGTPRLSSLIRFWLSIHEASRQAIEQSKLRRSLVAFLWKNRDPRMKLQDWLDGLLLLGLKEVVEQNLTRTDERESLESLREALADPRKIANICLGEFSGLRGSPEHLTLITLHSSKGLEFDVIILMGLEQGRIPDYRAVGEALEEERRKFYVGLTRAKHEVHLVYSGWYETRKRQRWHNGRSKFIDELDRQKVL
jgi:DNA helicase II / ATP-dependent DNA helicase PcrA